MVIGPDGCFKRSLCRFGWSVQLKLTDPGSVRFGDAARSGSEPDSELVWASEFVSESVGLVWGVVHFCGFFLGVFRHGHQGTGQMV